MFKSSLIQRLKTSVTAFQKREDGILTIFGVGVFILMMLAGGIALDFMRFESERSRLQNTLDRATLAAASLNQQLDQQQVIQDYFRAAGLSGYELDISIEETAGSRTIRAETSAPVRSLFLNMLGVDSISAPASSGAAERIVDLEISLVLDVSGSMGGTKIERLREAAGDFVQNMMDISPGNVTISIVPYNGKVNAGSVINAYYNISTDEHELSNCVRFDSSDFSTAAISEARILPRVAHFDTQTDDLNEGPGGITNPYCPTDNQNAIVPFASDAAKLEDYIDSLSANGWTAVDVGMKWGVALLDPSARSRAAAMAADDVSMTIPDGATPVVFNDLVSDDHNDRPVSYDDEDTLKIVVVMTDGANTNQEDLRSAKRGNALSPIFAYHDDFAGSGGTRDDAINSLIMEDDEHTRYSVWFDDMNTFYEWRRDDRRSTPVGGGDAVQLTWHEANSIFPVDYMQDQIVWRSATRSWTEGGVTYSRYRYGGYAENQWIPDDDYYFWREDTDYVHTGNSGANTNLSNVCSTARGEGIVIYSIAFQADSGGETAMRDCAHEDSFYYEVDDFNIARAFDGIEDSIRALKLIQ
jgi:Flp pilus assembly protein TadG